MKRRILPCLLALFVVLIGSFLLTVFLKDAPEAQALSTTDRTLYVAKKEAAGLYGEVVLIGSGSQYTLYLPGSADAAQLFFSWEADTTVLDANNQPMTSGAAPIAAPGAAVTYTVNGTPRTISTQKSSPYVQAMFLDTDTSLSGFSSFAAVNNDRTKETKAAGMMTLGSEAGYYFSIKGRGNSTWTHSHGKKPYNITLYKDGTYAKKKAVELIDGVEAKSWSLLANEGDQSLLRNRLGYELACAMGIGLSSDFVDLYVDGEYLGNYLMTPKSDYQAPDEGFIVEIDNYIDSEDPQFTLDGLAEYHPSDEGFQNRITVKDNGADLPVADIQSYMQAAWNALLDEDSDDYLNYIDLDSWAKYYLLHEYYKSFDVVCGSILMHRDGTSASDKLIAGPVWDLDNALGRISYNVDLGNNNVGVSKLQQHSPEGWYIQNVYDAEPWYTGGPTVSAFWLQQLGKHESFMARVRQIYTQYASVFQGAAPMLDQISNRIEASAQMNFHLHGYYNTQSTLSSSDACGCVATRNWSDYVSNLRNYASKRASFLASGFAADVTVSLNYDQATGNNTSSLICHYADTYGLLPSPTKNGYTFNGWFTGPNGTGQKITGTSVVMNTQNHTLYASWTAVQTQPTTPSQPSASSTTRPTVPGTTQPTTPGTTQPTVPGTTQPTVPGTTQPTTGVPQPTAPVTTPGVSTAATTGAAVQPTTGAAPTTPAVTGQPTSTPEITNAAPTDGSQAGDSDSSTQGPNVLLIVLLSLLGLALIGGGIFYYVKLKAQ